MPDITRVAKYAPKDLFGREAQLARLDAALADPKTRVYSLIAFGGVGKTALTAHWLAQLAARDWPGLERVFGWSFYSQGNKEDSAASSDAFFSAAFEFFEAADAESARQSPWEKGTRLARCVAAQPSLLVLDGLEPLQYPPGPLEGRLKDQAIEALLTGLAQSVKNGGGLCLVTSREPVKELECWPTAGEWRLEFLSEEAGAALLHSLGVTRAGAGTIAADDAELRQASREMGGHALTLRILGLYLAKAERGDVRKRDTVALDEAANPYGADYPEAYGHAFKVMAAYEKWLKQGGKYGARQLAILRLLGLFDRPADPGCLAALRAGPPIAGLTEPLAGLGAREWNLVVADLEAAGLVQTAEYVPKPVYGYGEEIVRKALEAYARNEWFDLGEPQAFPIKHLPLASDHSLDAHPLLRDYFARRLRDTQPDAWREGQRRLFEYLKSSVPFWPEGEAGLQPLYQAVAHGCRAGLYEEACSGVYWDRILRGKEHYTWHKLGLYGAELGAQSCFFKSLWSCPVSALSEGNRAWLFNEVAFCLRALGRLNEALEPMRVGLKMRVQQEVWGSAARIVGNLSELELTLGRMEAAVADAERAVDYADRSGNAFERTSQRTTLADAFHQAGRRDEALARFREAEAMQAERQPKYPLLYSLLSFRYCDALLAEAERAAWRFTTAEEEALTACRAVAERVTQTLKIAVDQFGSLSIALEHLTLARAALYVALLTDDSAHLVTARRHVDAAVNSLRASGNQDELPRGLLTRAHLHAATANPEAARDDLDAAECIATRGGMRLHLADVHLHRARLFHDRAALAEARWLINECGYERRRGELEDAEAAARGW